LQYSPGTFSRHWQQVNDWLSNHQSFWRSVPFMEPSPEWCRQHPDLASEMARLSDHQCDQLTDNPMALAVLAGTCLPSLGDWPHLVDVPELAPSEERLAQATLPERNARDMPGRKRLQAGAFAAAMAPLVQPALDWCCGKGHLARTLASGGVPAVLGLEWDKALVHEGNRLATHYHDPVTIQHQDVMAGDLPLPEGVHGVALHACGDLHRQLIRRGCVSGLPRLSFSPCCYHLGNDLAGSSVYRPLSGFVASHTPALILRRNDIRMAVQETVTAPARVREQTRLIRQWRLGFDSLQRHLRGVDEYLPVPSYPPGRIRDGFEVFCHWAAQKKGLALPGGMAFDAWLEAGAARLERVRRYELVRHLFRRPLELWLVLDYAIFLEEQGYQVRLGQFCARSLTPRNLMIDAVKPAGAFAPANQRLT
jgi:hypothetical protein